MCIARAYHKYSLENKSSFIYSDYFREVQFETNFNLLPRFVVDDLFFFFLSTKQFCRFVTLHGMHAMFCLTKNVDF